MDAATGSHVDEDEEEEERRGGKWKRKGVHSQKDGAGRDKSERDTREDYFKASHTRR